MSAYTRFGFAGETEIPALPTMTSFGSPLVRRCHVFPPSVERKSPPSMLPESIDQGLRSTVHAAANSVFGFFTSIEMSATPVLSLIVRTCSHVFPPSFVRKTPRSLFGPKMLPTTATNAMSGFCGWILMRPMRPAFSMPTCVHVLPASDDLYTPSPLETLPRGSAEPVPT